MLRIIFGVKRRRTMGDRVRGALLRVTALGVVPVVLMGGVLVYVQRQHPETASAYVDQAWDWASELATGERDRREAERSLFLQQADRLERAGDGVAWAAYVVGYAEQASPAETRAVLERTVELIESGDGRLPVWYVRAAYLDATGQAEAALQAFASAELVARCDTARLVEGPGALARVREVSELMPGLASRWEGLALAERESLVLQALTAEADARDRSPAVWVVGDGPSEELDAARWQLVRQAVRAQWSEAVLE
ncbi:MAG: hypothetical protein AAF797_09530 [Planctomycetota bacterium]